MKSAATRSAPVPPGVCAVTPRRFAHDLMIGPQEHLADMTIVFGQSIDSQVTLVRLCRQQAFLGFLDHVEYRRLALGVLVDTDREVDLVRVRIFLERFAQSQDGIGRGHLQLLEHRSQPFSNELSPAPAGRRCQRILTIVLTARRSPKRTCGGEFHDVAVGLDLAGHYCKSVARLPSPPSMSRSLAADLRESATRPWSPVTTQP